ncbi:MAG: N-acetyltransferase [Clostridia bacterium]|nr:N-acetyltransferase [Clostridia bacterium]
MRGVRSAGADDAGRLAQIYAYYVEHTAISFEYDAPSEDEFRRRIESTLEKFPYLVLEEDGVILGYAYAGVFKARAAYDRSCELSVYVERTARRRGVGRALYEALEADLKARGMLNLYACVACPVSSAGDEYLTRDSERFHRRLGFETVGTFHRCAYKFGRWYDMIWMEKLIGAHEDAQERTTEKAENEREEL